MLRRRGGARAGPAAAELILAGSFLLIGTGANATVGTGMLHPPANIVHPEHTDCKK